MIASAAGIPTVVAGAASASAALAGEAVGTYFAPHGRRPATRLLWLKHAAVARGSLNLDKGAVEAVVRRHASLLPAGITGVEGSFDAGDPVNLRDENGAVVARGLVNYDAAEIPGLMGRSTRWLASKLGPEYEREVVHRDDLVILLKQPRDHDHGQKLALFTQTARDHESRGTRTAPSHAAACRAAKRPAECLVVVVPGVAAVLQPVEQAAASPGRALRHATEDPDQRILRPAPRVLVGPSPRS